MTPNQKVMDKASTQRILPYILDGKDIPTQLYI